MLRVQGECTPRDGEAGATGGAVCWKDGINQQTLYFWKKKYASLGFSELRPLREENSQRKRLGADRSLDRHILPELVAQMAGSLGPGALWGGRATPSPR